VSANPNLRDTARTVEFRGETVSFQITFDALNQLAAGVMEGFKALRRRGVEVGGVLTGRIDNEGRGVIESIELVSIEYRYGPSYVLSKEEEARLRAAVAKAESDRRQVLGFFRSNTRTQLALTAEDVDLMHRNLPASAGVALLIKPMPLGDHVAAVFVWAGDRFRQEPAFLEFPVRRAGDKPPANSTHEEPAQEPAPVTPPLFPAGIAAPRRPWVWGLASGAVGVAAAMLTLTWWLGRPSGAKAAGALGLMASRSGDQMRVKWDRDSPALEGATFGVVVIRDGPWRKDIRLDPTQLRTGSLIYSPATPDVAFELVIEDGGLKRISESLQMVSSAGLPRAEEPSAEPSRPRGATSDRSRRRGEPDQNTRRSGGRR
jgi:hypothetical protein